MNKVNPIFTDETRQLPLGILEKEIAAAQAYEAIFVPALFQFWCRHLISAANLSSGQRTLDIACGTGVLTRELMAITGTAPPPTGLDISSGMLEVAASLNPEIIWQLGSAMALPFRDQSFDGVFCQYGLMFFNDRIRALREMSRVLAPGGRIVIAVWDKLENNPGFAEKVSILDTVAGKEAGDALRAPFCLGGATSLEALLRQAGFEQINIQTCAGRAAFKNVHEFVEAEVRGWLPVMDVHLSESVIEEIHTECRNRLGGYEDDTTGQFYLSTSAHIVTLQV